MTTFEMIDRLHAQTVHHIQLLPGQVLSPDHTDVQVSQDMPPQMQAALLQKLSSVKMDVVGYGTLALAGDAEWRKAFEFAKKFKAKNIIISVQPPDVLKKLDALAAEFAINVAIFFDPHTTEFDPALFSDHVGIYATVANWQRLGLDPAQTIARLGSHIIEIQLSDIDSPTPFLAPVVAQCKTQNFKGIFCISCQPKGGVDPMPAFIDSVNAFSEQVRTVVGNSK